MRCPDLLLVALLGAGCSTSAIANLVPAPPPTAAEQDDYVAYGGAGHLTDSGLVTLQNLTWPQSYGAIKDAIGLPHIRTEDADIYKLGDGSVWVYYQGTEATGYEVQ